MIAYGIGDIPWLDIEQKLNRYNWSFKETDKPEYLVVFGINNLRRYPKVIVIDSIGNLKRRKISIVSLQLPLSKQGHKIRKKPKDNAIDNSLVKYDSYIATIFTDLYKIKDLEQRKLAKTCFIDSVYNGSIQNERGKVLSLALKEYMKGVPIKTVCKTYKVSNFDMNYLLANKPKRS